MLTSELPSQNVDEAQRSSAAAVPTYHKNGLVLVCGEGSRVMDEDGQWYLDLYGGHCVAGLGHCPERVVEAIREQVGTLVFYSNVVDNPLRTSTCELLARLAPESLGNVFFCNSGAEANETALKLARVATGRQGIIAMKNGFHGRTLGSLAATWNPVYREPYLGVLPTCDFVPFGDAAAVEQVLQGNGDIAAVLVEPIQSIAGVVEAPDDYFHDLRSLCDRFGAMLIFDEVQTGVGRTGTFSYAGHLAITPDLITMAKSLGSGVPVGAVLISDAIASRIRPGDHGSTFGGGMVAMAAVKATLETIVEEGLMDRAVEVNARVRATATRLGFSVRGRGCLIGLESQVPAKDVVALLRQHGVLVGSSADPSVIRLMPPLNTTDEELALFDDALATVASEIH